MAKPILFTRQIHSCCASASSMDKYACIYISDLATLDFTLADGVCINSKQYPILNGMCIAQITGDAIFNIVYLNEDKTFYERALNSRRLMDSYEKTPEFAALIKNYEDAGWEIRKTYTYPEVEELRKRQEELENEQHFLTGVVLNLPYEEYKGKPELYQGGFSDAVFNSPTLKKYLGDGTGVFGWIGNRGSRKAWHDTLIEEGLRNRGISDDGMYSWISSSNGRHFAESLEGHSDDEQREKIENALNHMFNLCIIYNSPDHGGTMTSTVSISNMLDTWGVLLGTKSTYDGSGPEKLLKYVEQINSIKNITEEQKEKFLSIVSPVILQTYNELNPQGLPGINK